MLHAQNKFWDWIASIEGLNVFRKDRYPNWAPIVCEECSFYFENGDKWAKYTSGVCQVKPLLLQKSEKSRQVSVGHGVVLLFGLRARQGAR